MPRAPRRDRPSPIYQDVIRGSGGIAGGYFTLGGDTLTGSKYVAAEYIIGQGGYIQGD